MAIRPSDSTQNSFSDESARTHRGARLDINCLPIKEFEIMEF